MTVRDAVNRWLSRGSEVADPDEPVEIAIIPLATGPLRLSPQAHRDPSLLIAKFEAPPEKMADTPDNVEILAGANAVDLSHEPRPSVPDQLTPHDHTVPSLLSARLELLPAEIAVMLLRFFT